MKSIYRGIGRCLRLPFFLWRQIRFAQTVTRLSKTFADEFRNKLVPAFVAELEKAEQEDVSRLEPPRRFNASTFGFNERSSSSRVTA